MAIFQEFHSGLEEGQNAWGARLNDLQKDTINNFKETMRSIGVVGGASFVGLLLVLNVPLPFAYQAIAIGLVSFAFATCTAFWFQFYEDHYTWKMLYEMQEVFFVPLGIAKENLEKFSENHKDSKVSQKEVDDLIATQIAYLNTFKPRAEKFAKIPEEQAKFKLKIQHLAFIFLSVGFLTSLYGILYPFLISGIHNLI